MGRTPLPQQVKEKRGTLRKCRTIKTEASAVVKLTEVNVPAHLKGEAKKIYEIKVRQCLALGILHEIDADALSLYAWELAELIRLSQELKQEGYTIEVETKFGTETKINPKEKVVRAKLAIVNTLGSQFGWSPVSRIRLAAMARGDKESKNEFAEFTE